MTEDQKTIVKTTWTQVLPISEQAAEIFYAKLFALDPNVKPLFANTDMKEQGKKLMQMITVAVNGLDRLENLMGAVRDLGRRHVGYGVQPGHYDTVGAALLDTLAAGLGDAFTPEAREAWALTYTTLANIMKDAACEEAA